MKNRDNTIIQQLQFCQNENQIYIKRDDLFPFSFGGNKVRIANEFFSDMERKSKNCIIGSGNTRSNLCRAIANMAYQKEIPCHIVSPFDDDETKVGTSNNKILHACGAVVHECSKQNVAETIKNVLNKCEKAGLKPYYINGNIYGKGNEATPVLAYYKVYNEIVEQAKDLNLHFDYIFLATETGMTQSGLLAGKQIYNGKEHIIGISVSRLNECSLKAISNYLNSYYLSIDYTPNIEDEIIVLDQYLLGGYGKYNSAIVNVISEMIRKEGIPLDPTYTGKAFYGMEDYLKKNNITKKNILFIHTGGTPLFFDLLNGKEPAVQSSMCENKEKIVDFLRKVDNLFPIALHYRVDLDKYAEKIVKNGKIVTVEINSEIVSAAMFYCNNLDNHTAFLTLLVTLPEYEGKGYGHVVLEDAENYSKSEGMIKMKLDTDKINTHAVAFYSKCGYVIEYVKERIHMKKEL